MPANSPATACSRSRICATLTSSWVSTSLASRRRPWRSYSRRASSRSSAAKLSACASSGGQLLLEALQPRLCRLEGRAQRRDQPLGVRKRGAILLQCALERLEPRSARGALALQPLGEPPFGRQLSLNLRAAGVAGPGRALAPLRDQPAQAPGLLLRLLMGAPQVAQAHLERLEALLRLARGQLVLACLARRLLDLGVSVLQFGFERRKAAALAEAPRPPPRGRRRTSPMRASNATPSRVTAMPAKSSEASSTRSTTQASCSRPCTTSATSGAGRTKSINRSAPGTGASRASSACAAVRTSARAPSSPAPATAAAPSSRLDTTRARSRPPSAADTAAS